MVLELSAHTTSTLLLTSTLDTCPTDVWGGRRRSNSQSRLPLSAPFISKPQKSGNCIYADDTLVYLIQVREGGVSLEVADIY